MDDSTDSLPNHLFISIRHEFKATRIIGQRLSPTTIRIKTDVSPLEDDSEEYGFRMEVALAKMSFFVDKILDECVMFHKDNQWAKACFVGEDDLLSINTTMICPEEPTDAMLCEIILCKFKALCQDAFEFMSIEVESTDARGMSFLFVGGTPGDTFTPTEEWLTPHNYFSKPWWHRNDASTLDIVPHEDADLNEPPAWAYSLGFIAEQLSGPVTRDNVVVRGEFRPKVIDGGKTD
jgi:hypothetical protein